MLKSLHGCSGSHENNFPILCYVNISFFQAFVCSLCAWKLCPNVNSHGCNLHEIYTFASGYRNRGTKRRSSPTFFTLAFQLFFLILCLECKEEEVYEVVNGLTIRNLQKIVRPSVVNLSFSFRTPSTDDFVEREDRRLPTVETRTKFWTQLLSSRF